MGDKIKYLENNKIYFNFKNYFLPNTQHYKSRQMSNYDQLHLNWKVFGL